MFLARLSSLKCWIEVGRLVDVDALGICAVFSTVDSWKSSYAYNCTLETIYNICEMPDICRRQ